MDSLQQVSQQCMLPAAYTGGRLVGEQSHYRCASCERALLLYVCNGMHAACTSPLRVPTLCALLRGSESAVRSSLRCVGTERVREVAWERMYTPISPLLLCQLRFDLPATYAFHSAQSVDVAVDLLRFVKGPAGRALAARHDTIPPWAPPPTHALDPGSGRGGRATGGSGGSSLRGRNHDSGSSSRASGHSGHRGGARGGRGTSGKR